MSTLCHTVKTLQCMLMYAVFVTNSTSWCCSSNINDLRFLTAGFPFWTTVTFGYGMQPNLMQVSTPVWQETSLAWQAAQEASQLKVFPPPYLHFITASFRCSVSRDPDQLSTRHPLFQMHVFQSDSTRLACYFILPLEKLTQSLRFHK